jgi:tRNA-modifying protein YgfZ
MADAKEMPVLLDRAGLIEIAGADAVAFAHAQFASDVASLAVDAMQWSAWLSAQGRARAVFALLRVAHDRLLVWMPLGNAPRIRDALARFVLRSKVTLTVHGEWMLGTLPDGSLRSAGSLETRFGGFAFAPPGSKPRVAWLGPAAGEIDSEALDTWRVADIEARLPWIAEATEDQFVPQALDLQRLDAVRFDKGCYPGQEIAARLHFRGGNKQRLHRVTLHGDADAPPGLRIEGASGHAGMLLYGAPRSASKREGLAVLSDAAISTGKLLSASGHSVELPQQSS